MSDPYAVIEQFEAALCEYTGAPYAIAVNSCTNALFLALMWANNVGAFPDDDITIPRRTYVSVPMQIAHAGFCLNFSDSDWWKRVSCYQLEPLPIWDCARKFNRNMYRPGQFQCLSFHWTKILGIQHGGAILHDNDAADEWLRRARFDGRLPREPPEAATMIGWHCLTTPEVAAAGLVRLANLPDNPPDLPNPNYPDLSKMEIFQ